MDEHTARLNQPRPRRQRLGARLLIVALVLISPSVGDSQVSTTITSSGLNTTISHVGGTTMYDITGGTRPGSGLNLFHSFGDFNVGPGDTANFFNDSGLATSNILGRVTGGNISHIYGTIQIDQTFGNANLFLMNPSGFVFGPTASLNVGGAVSFTTAQYIRLFDGVGSANFHANPAYDIPERNSILTIDPLAFTFLTASPAAYGFLTAPAPDAMITVQGSTLTVPDALLGSPPNSISLVGGKIIIQGDTLPDGTVQQSAQLSAPNGSIFLATSASPGEFDVSTLQSLPNVEGTSFTSYGSVSLAPGSSIDVNGVSTVWIKGGQLVLSVNDASLGTSDVPAQIDTISLTQGSSIWTSNAGTDPGADGQLIAPNIRLMNRSLIITQTSGSGPGGDIQLTTDKLTVENSSAIVTRNSDLGLVGGDLVLNVGVLQLKGGDSGRSQIASINNTGTDLNGDGLVDVTGVGGNITVHGIQGSNGVADSVVLSGSSLITSDAGSTGGNGGEISIRTTSLDLGEASVISSSTTGTGHGGNILVEVQTLRVVGDSTISSSTGSENLVPAAGGTVTVQGLTGSGGMASSVLLSGRHTGIFSDSLFGLPGNVTVNAKSLTITDGAVISTGSALSGPAGAITVTADSVVIVADGQIVSQSFAQDSGQVTITAKAVTINHGSIVTNTTSESGGHGGDVVISSGTVALTNGAKITSESEASSTGRAGDIAVNAPSITLHNGSTISSSSAGTGNAGNISINSKAIPGRIFEMVDSQINTSAALADGGNIEIYATDLVRLTDSTITSSVGNPSKTDTVGGNITIDPNFVVLQGSQIRANAFAGDGGNINITAGLFLADAFSQQNISASSETGLSGTVEINAPINNLSSVVARLSDSLIEVDTLLRAACAARLAEGQASSFVERGRDSMPAGPEGLLASPYLPLTSTSLARSPGPPSREFSGIQIRRRSGGETPPPILLHSDPTACSS